METYKFLVHLALPEEATEINTASEEDFYMAHRMRARRLLRETTCAEGADTIRKLVPNATVDIKPLARAGCLKISGSQQAVNEVISTLLQSGYEKSDLNSLLR